MMAEMFFYFSSVPHPCHFWSDIYKRLYLQLGQRLKKNGEEYKI